MCDDDVIFSTTTTHRHLSSGSPVRRQHSATSTPILTSERNLHHRTPGVAGSSLNHRARSTHHHDEDAESKTTNVESSSSHPIPIATTVSSSTTDQPPPTAIDTITQSLKILALPFILLNLVTILWGTQHAVIKSTLIETPEYPGVVNFLRFSLASVLFLPWTPNPFDGVQGQGIWKSGASLGFWMFLGECGVEKG